MPNFSMTAKFNKIPSTGFVPESSGSAPSSPVNGQLWIDTSVTPKLMKVWDGSAWAPCNLYAGTTSTTYAAGDDSRITGAVQTSTKNAANGVAGLDAGGRIAAAQLPSVITAAGQTGAATTVRFVGGSGAAAAPSSGTFNTGDVVIGTDGSVYVCTAGGTPGTWRRSLRDNELGAASGIATLDGTTKIPIAQIPTGSTSTTVTIGNDARLSDTRTPSASSIVDSMVAAGAAIAESKLNLATDAATGTGSRRTLGYTGLSAMPGIARLDQIAAPTASVSMNSQRLTALAPSSAGTDAVNRNELDAARQGYAGAKDPVRVAATTNITLATPGANIDGVAMVSGDRVLLTAQTTALENGIWVWTGSGTPLTRSTDADAVGEIKDGTTVAVAAGTGAGTVYIQTASVDTTAPGVTTAEVWVQFTTQATYVGTANRITVVGTTIDISAAYVGQTSITTLGTITTGTWTGTSIAVLNGGTGSTTPAGARTNLGAGQAGYQATIASALVAGTPLTITHSLNTDKCIAQVRDATTGEYITLDIIDAPGTPNTLTITSGIAYLANTLDIVVIPI